MEDLNTIHNLIAGFFNGPEKIASFADEVVLGSNEPMLEGLLVIAKGQKMQGQFFPLLIS